MFARSPNPGRHVLATALAIGALLTMLGVEARAQCFTTGDCWPQPGCAYTGTSTVPLPPFGSRRLSLESPTSCTPPPPPGPAIDSFFDVFFEIELTFDNGAHWNHYSGNAHCGMRVRFDHVAGPTRFFDVEMLQMDLVGGTLPPNVRLRESPTQPSPGQTTIQDVGGGQYRIDSFFDVFTELSIDNGATWMPSNTPHHETLVPLAVVPVHPATWGALKTFYR